MNHSEPGGLVKNKHFGLLGSLGSKRQRLADWADLNRFAGWRVAVLQGCDATEMKWLRQLSQPVAMRR